MPDLKADKEIEERLIRNITEFRRIENETLSPGLGKEELLNCLQQRANRNTAIMADNNGIILEYLDPRLDNIENIGNEDAEGFFILAQRLHTLKQSLDIGLAFRIHSCLIKRARAESNTGHIVRQLYWMGLIKMQMDQKLFRKEATEYFVEGASYRERYFDIENKETRMYINRCLGNAYVAVSGLRRVDLTGTLPTFLAYVDLALEFWNDEKVRERDPDFPWTAYILNAHQNICAWNDVQANGSITDLSLAKRIFDSFTVLVEGKLKAAKWTWTENRTEYLRLSASYHAGRLSFDEMTSGLERLFYSVEAGDYSDNGIYSILHISPVILHYYEYSPAVSKEWLADKRRDILDRVLAYLKAIPGGIDKQRLNELLGQFANHFVMNDKLEDYLYLLLRFTSFSHLPTYVHSMQVKNISMIFTDYFIRENPALLAGICGIGNEAGAADGWSELLGLVELAALCHDIGKLSYANTVALCSRKLFDYEFRLIQQHPATGYWFRPVNETMGCLRDIILGHHKWYDGQKGYPDEFDNTQSKYKIIIDIITAADSIEAATDIIGRSYSQGRTLTQVVDEIQKQAGTRYSPVIAEALKDESLVGEIEICIIHGRRDSYYNAYRDMTGRTGEE
jgi:hypothetical protein